MKVLLEPTTPFVTPKCCHGSNQHRHALVLLLSTVLLLLQQQQVFCFVSIIQSRSVISNKTPSSLLYEKSKTVSSTTTTTTATNTDSNVVKGDNFDDHITRIEACIKEGRNPRSLIDDFERQFPSHYKEPNRSPDFLGTWYSLWTDCPPPSNGRLGPFQGQVVQEIKSNGEYINFLKVPPNDWLTATLYGVWEDWDGTVLAKNEENQIGNTNGDSNNKFTESSTRTTTKLSNDTIENGAVDWGANHWKVTFKRLQIGLLGFTLVDKVFPPNTSRVWRTTYLSDGIRIVRAGQTGKIEDEYVFYTKRQPLS